MAEKKRKKQDEDPGAPEWMVTFSDCMTLLLTFFVLLLSFSTFERKEYEQIQASLNHAFESIGPVTETPQEAFTQIKLISELEEGSETVTQDTQRGSLEHTTVDFRDFKVFIIESEKLFWAKGSAINEDGGKLLDKMAEFMEKMPGKIVISENGPENSALARAVSVVDYFSKAGLSSERFSISSQNMSQATGKGRTTEIVFLDRSLF